MWTLLTQSLHHLVGQWWWVWPMSPPVWPRPRMCQQCSPPERPHWHCSQSPAGRDWFTGHRPLWQRALSGAHHSHLPNLHLKSPCLSRGQLFKDLCEVTGHLGGGAGGGVWGAVREPYSTRRPTQPTVYIHIPSNPTCPTLSPPHTPPTCLKVN